jgi:CheY-like chemotaxis protein
MSSDTRARVLVVDDDADHLELLSRILRRNYEVSVASDGLDGYALACLEHPSAIILDVMMPVVDGWTVLRKLRANPTTRHLAVIVVTASDRAAALAAAAGLDVSLVLQKPVDPNRLLNAVERSLRR